MDRQCTKCLSWKPATSDYFYVRRDRRGGALQSRCKACWARYEPCKDVRTTLLKGARSRALQYKVPFALEITDIKVPETCPIFGIPLKRNLGRGMDDSPSIDRIVPELGYIPKNITVISNKANRIKNNGTAAEHEAIVAYIRSQEKVKCEET